MNKFKLAGHYGFTIDGQTGTQKNLQSGSTRQMRLRMPSLLGV